MDLVSQIRFSKVVLSDHRQDITFSSMAHFFLLRSDSFWVSGMRQLMQSRVTVLELYTFMFPQIFSTSRLFPYGNRRCYWTYMENKISFLGDEMCSSHWCCVYVSWAFNWKFVGKTNMGKFLVWDARGTSMLILLFLYVESILWDDRFIMQTLGRKQVPFWRL